MMDNGWNGGFAPGGGATIIIGGGNMTGAAMNNNPPAPAPAPEPAANPSPQPATPAPATPSSSATTAAAAATTPAVGDSGVSFKTVTLTQAMTDLQAAIADKATTEDQLKEKIAIVRDARDKTKADIESARKELLLILTTDQEATLVSMGLLP
jgi:hypothetical protein